MLHVEIKAISLSVSNYCGHFAICKVIECIHTWILSTMSEIFAPPRETPKKLPPARLIFWTTCLESWMKEKSQVPLNIFINVPKKMYTDINEVEKTLTGTSDKWSSKNPRNPCCIPTMFFTPYFSSVSTIYKSTNDTIEKLEYCSVNTISEILVLSKTRSTPVQTYLPDDIIETRAEPTTCYNPSLYILRLEIYLFTWTSTVYPGKDKPGCLGKDK